MEEGRPLLHTSLATKMWTVVLEGSSCLEGAVKDQSGGTSVEGRLPESNSDCSRSDTSCSETFWTVLRMDAAFELRVEAEAVEAVESVRWWVRKE